jgi:hypothetical protein
MNFKSIQINDTEQFGNGWGLYVDIDIENSYPKNNNHDFVKEKYIKTGYYNSYDKIDEELEYYEYEYDKKREEEELKQAQAQTKQIELKQIQPKQLQGEPNIIRNNSSSLLFNISSITLLTAAISYCFIAAL